MADDNELTADQRRSVTIFGGVVLVFGIVLLFVGVRVGNLTSLVLGGVAGFIGVALLYGVVTEPDWLTVRYDDSSDRHEHLGDGDDAGGGE